MYEVIKELSISGAHKLKLPYRSDCKELHGHNWKITVYLKADKLNSEGMIMDFKIIKEKINKLDHAYINDVIGSLNPTAENIAKWICDEIGKLCYKVVVQESEGNIAVYHRE